jgi:hypothetical protein
VSGDDEPRAREVLRQVADRRLLAGVERRAHGFDGRVREPAPSPSLRVHVEPETWGAGYLNVREREIPPELMGDLDELTPQANLRDLFRPVMESIWHEREPMTEALDPGGRRAWAELRASRVLEARPTIAPTAREVAAEQRRRRAWAAEPWKPAMTDDQPRREVMVHREPSLIA